MMKCIELQLGLTAVRRRTGRSSVEKPWLRLLLLLKLLWHRLRLVRLLLLLTGRQ